MKFFKIAGLAMTAGLLASNVACSKMHVNKGPNYKPIQKPTANCPAGIDGQWQIMDGNTGQVRFTTAISSGVDGKKYVGEGKDVFVASCADNKLSMQDKDNTGADVKRTFWTSAVNGTTVGYYSESRKNPGDADFSTPETFGMLKVK